MHTESITKHLQSQYTYVPLICQCVKRKRSKTHKDYQHLELTVPCNYNMNLKVAHNKKAIQSDCRMGQHTEKLVYLLRINRRETNGTISSHAMVVAYTKQIGTHLDPSPCAIE